MKYYLICSFCSHYNEVSSEYLTFCDDCKKKLYINYREWEKQHPGKTFEDFKHAECISDVVARPVENPLKEQARKKPDWLKISFVILFFLTLFVLFIPSTYKDSLFDSLIDLWSRQKALEFNWERQTYGDYGLSIESPVILKPIDLPSTQPGNIKEAQPFSSDTDEEFSLVVISTEFSSNAGQISLQTSISTFIYQIQNMPNISNFKVSQSETSINGVPGFEQKGTFIQDGVHKAFTSIGASRGKLLWQIMVLYNEDDKVHEKAAQRIISSALILYNTAA